MFDGAAGGRPFLLVGAYVGSKGRREAFFLGEGNVGPAVPT